MTMTIKRILVPVNGTSASEHAFRWACQLVKNTKSELHAVYVSEVPQEFPLNTEFVSEDTRGEQVLARIETISTEEKCRVHAQILQGRHAGPAIVLEAEDREMELIILGIPFRHRVGSSILGTTASYLLEHAPCQVVLWSERVQAAALTRA